MPCSDCKRGHERRVFQEGNALWSLGGTVPALGFRSRASSHVGQGTVSHPSDGLVAAEGVRLRKEPARRHPLRAAVSSPAWLGPGRYNGGRLRRQPAPAKAENLRTPTARHAGAQNNASQPPEAPAARGVAARRRIRAIFDDTGFAIPWSRILRRSRGAKKAGPIGLGMRSAG